MTGDIALDRMEAVADAADLQALEDAYYHAMADWFEARHEAVRNLSASAREALRFYTARLEDAESALEVAKAAGELPFVNTKGA